MLYFGEKQVPPVTFINRIERVRYITVHVFDEDETKEFVALSYYIVDLRESK